MKNYRTPRTMAETTFATGYPVSVSSGASIGLAVVIGVVLAVLLVHGIAS